MIVLHGKLTLDRLEDVLNARGLEKFGSVQERIDSEVLRLSAPYVPQESSFLLFSGIVNTALGSGKVKYNTPYARRWYYEPANFHGAPMRGNFWFKRMVEEGGKEAIQKVVAAMTGGKFR